MDKESTRFTRRKLLGAGTGAFAAGLAGCTGNRSGDGGDGSSGDGADGSDGTPATTDSSGGDGGSSIGDDTLEIMDGRRLTQIHFNSYNVANYAGTWGTMIHEFTASGHSDGTVKPDLLEGMTVDGKVLTMKFPEGFTWWNGKALTAEDFYTGLEITRLQDPEAEPHESHELVDEYTVKRTFKESTTPGLMRASIAGFAVDTPRWVYGEYLERYQDATTQDERDAVSEDLLKMTIPTEQVVDEGLGNSVYQLTEFNSSEGILELYEDHPYAERTNVPRTRVIPWDAADPEAFITQDKIDLALGDYITEAKRSRYPSNLQNQYKLDWFRTQKFTFNYKNEHLGKRNVRRAIAAAVDLNSIVAAASQAGIVGSPTEVQTGLRSSIHSEFLGDGYADGLIQYPVSGDADAAAAYMERAGYTKQNGEWVDPNGESFTLSILTESRNASTQATKVFSDQVNAFGINAEVNSVGTDYYTKLQEYEFDIAWIWHVAKAIWHPTAYFSNNFYGVEVGDPTSGDETGPTGIPFETEIPQEPGTEEISGSGRTIRPAKLMTDMPVASSRAEVKEMTRTLVHWFNYDLPALVYVQEDSGYWGDADNFTFPDPEETELLSKTRPGRVAWMHGWIGGK